MPHPMPAMMLYRAAGYLIDDHELDRDSLFAEGGCQACTLRGSHESGDGHDDELGRLRVPEQSLCFLHAFLQHMLLNLDGSHRMTTPASCKMLMQPD